MAARRSFLARAYIVGRLGGVEVAIHPSWVIMVGVIAVIAPYDSTVSGLLGGLLRVAVALLFYVFVVVHELAHTLVARAWRLEPKRIVLFMFGGVSQISREATEPRQEFHVAIAGPLASLLFAGVLAAVAMTLHPGTSIWKAGIWGFFAVLNALLAIFNMLPGFPLDGGRVLRSGLWHLWSDRAKATRWAALGGKVLAGGLMAGGGAILLVSMDDFSGAAPTGVWYVVLGWILYSIAGTAGRHESETAAPAGPATAPVVPSPAVPVAGGASSPARVTLATGAATLGVAASPERTERGGPISKPRPARKSDEGKASKSNARGGAARRSHRARAAPQARHQSRNRARDPRARPAHSRGGARRSRRG
jgi:Zn-dependent protease